MKKTTDSGPPLSAADLLALSKPTITLTSVMMAVGGLVLAGGSMSTATAIGVIAGVCGTVAAANALNMVIEKDSDALMERTRSRPIPTGRISAAAGTLAGLGYAAVGLGLLWWLTNPLTAAVGLAALLAYVAVYTPLKRVTPWALVVGAVPGAAPPLMGWTACTGTINGAGLGLFALLFLWQLPHFIAISVWRRDDYAKAGMPAYGVVRSSRAAQREAFAYASAMIPASLALVYLGAASWAFGGLAVILGAWFAGTAWSRGTEWSRKLFFASLAYLPAIVFALAADRWFFL